MGVDEKTLVEDGKTLTGGVVWENILIQRREGENCFMGGCLCGVGGKRMVGGEVGGKTLMGGDVQ